MTLDLHFAHIDAVMYKEIMRDLDEMVRREETVQVRHLDIPDLESSCLKLTATSQLPLITCVEFLLHKYPEVLAISEPQVVSLQTIQQEVEQSARIFVESDRPQYAPVYIKLTPLARGQGIEYLNAFTPLSPHWSWNEPEHLERIELCMREIEQTVQTTLQDEEAIGYKATDLRVTLLEIGFHPVDTKPRDFRWPTRCAVKDAIQKASPLRLEPIMDVQIEGVALNIKALVEMLAQYRGLDMLKTDQVATEASIRFSLPLAELLTLEKALASFQENGRKRVNVTKEFSHYASATNCASSQA